MSRSATALGVAFVFGLGACGSDDGGPTAPAGPELVQLHVTGEWPRAREPSFEGATWEVWWFASYPPGGMCMGLCGEFVTVAEGPIGRDGFFEGFTPEVECRDYRISLSGTYAQNRDPCRASSRAVTCSSEEQHFSDWEDLEFGSCVDGGEEPIPTFHLDVTITWDMSRDDGFNPGDWSLQQWSVDDIRWYKLDGGTIPSTGQFRVQTLVSCPDTWTSDGQLKVELSGRYPGGASCNLFVMPDCADTAQEIQIGPPADVCS